MTFYIARSADHAGGAKGACGMMNASGKATLIALALVLSMGWAGRPDAERLMAAEAGSVSKDSKEADATDWPQWRGPHRTGAAAESPPLIDEWPKGGPKVLWKSEKIPGAFRRVKWKTDFNGGSGSVTVAGGRAFLYAQFQEQTSFKVRTELLEKWGWHPDMPADLAEKVEEIRVKLFPRFGRNRYPPKEKLEAEIEKLLSSLEPAQAEKFESAIRKRLGEGCGCSLEFLNRLASVRGQEFESFSELQKKAGKLMAGHGGWQGKVVRNALLKEAKKFTDAIYCLDADTGKTLWTKKFPGKAPSMIQINWTGSSTPAVSGDHCFVQGSSALYCFSVDDGDLVWKQETGLSNVSPVVYGDTVFSMAPGLAAYDAKTGSKRWSLPEIEHRNSSPVLWDDDGTIRIICYTGWDIACVNAAEGKVLWKTHFSKGRNDPSPVVVGDIAVARGYSGLVCFKLTPEEPQKLWEIRRGGNRGSSPAVYDGLVYALGRSVFCVDLETGERKWSAGKHHTESTSPIVADGKVIAWIASKKDRKWHLIQFPAGADGFELHGDMTMLPAFYSSPSIANGKLYVRLIDGVVCYDLRK
jgi:outer membrane protein assembly factor BamB